MHPSQIKFHLIAVTAICAIVILLFISMGSEQPRPQVATDPYAQSIAIDSATWGRNCNQYAEQAQWAWDHEKHTSETLYNRPKKATYNNAIEAIKNACDGQISCQFTVSDDALKMQPIPNCAKLLTVNYRCYTYDRLHSKQVGNHEQLRIDCAKNLQ